jgi:cysteinyl-tRNA synthetase
MKIYNTLTKIKEEFIPVTPSEVKMYGCGVTPYKPSHLGHAMQGVIFDVIRRYFEYKGYKTTYVRNYTDIDDKIVAKAKELGIHPLEHSKNVMKQCDEDFDKLRVRKADYEPKVSDHIPEIIETIKILVDKGYAYVTSTGNVYYVVRQFADYGKLSHQKIEDLQHGTRKIVEEDKKDPLDFALWKSGEGGFKFWDSPWGNGRPGWHIECSAMSVKYLGKHFDIHGGGGDLIFPHHENEIAQSVIANDSPFANYWIHNGLLMVGKDKMSKSLNNDVSIGDWLELYHPDVIRYIILERYTEANKKVYEVYKSLSQANNINDAVVDQRMLATLMKDFEEAMDNDFNTVTVVANILALSSRIDTLITGSAVQKTEAKTIGYYIVTIGKILGLFDLEPNDVLAEMKTLELKKRNLTEDTIKNTIRLRTEARKTKDYTKSDEYRIQLQNLGVKIQDIQGVTIWDVDFM